VVPPRFMQIVDCMQESIRQRYRQNDQRIADGARQAFASEMGELLLYEREDAPPLFCAFSPYMANATRSASFGDTVMDTLAA